MTDPRDLIIFLADLDAENAIKSLLNRTESLRIRSILFNPCVDLLRHQNHDSGCYRKAVDFLRIYLKTHKHALVIFDREGCGKEDKSREEIELSIEEKLTASGWPKENVACIVFDPELEIWVWSNSQEVAKVLGWENRTELNQYLITKDLIKKPWSKPARPKEAMLKALRNIKISQSSSIFKELASKVSLSHCVDPTFIKFKTVLQRWFPPIDNSCDS